MKINNVSVTAVEFNNALIILRYVLLNNELGFKTTWPTMSYDSYNIYLNYDVDVESNFGYSEETRLSDNMSITCGHRAGCFWTSYPEE